MKLRGKTALVLGAVKGIGKGIALSLAEAGANVALTWYDWEESLEALEKEMAATGAPHLIRQIDLTDTGAVPGLVEAVMARFGGLDILINNIERGGWPVVHGRYTREQWDLEMATTLRAKQWVFEHALPHLKNSGDGAVINFSSIAGIVGRAGPASLLFNDAYSTASRGTSLLTETWARLGAPEVRVNEIILGVIDTRHGRDTRGWGLLSGKEKQAIRDHTLLGRTGSIGDVVKAVMFILKKAPFMTGSTLRIDGGYVLGGEKVGKMPAGVA
jgi:3-oxoacyl-[acyl-carrier protein] reductase